ncbi:MAG: hypothetical protein R3324_12155 [Halobacteriales archaeon]|nr:hypothetical protein [Halobacteriales archaeon]
MLSLTLDDFMIELKDGVLHNVGGATKAASAKLYDVVTAEAREFGDERVKLVFEDDEGNEVHVAVFPAEARRIARDIESLQEDSPVFE